MKSDVFLHCCCAPCSISCVESLRNEGIEPCLFWYNPNIHLFAEYKARRDCLTEFAKTEKVKLIMHDEYGLNSFLDVVYPKKENRCKICYRMRLEETAQTAAKEGYGSFSTTLLISPYQNHEAIVKIGEEVASIYNISFLYRDFRSLFREGQTAARAKSFYMQKYCGCIFSEEERYSGKQK